MGAPQAGADAATNSSFLEKLLEEVKKAFDVRFKEIEKRLPPSAASPAQNETRLVPVNYPSMMPTQFTLQPSSVLVLNGQSISPAATSTCRWKIPGDL